MRIKTVMNHNQNDGLLKMIRRTDPMISNSSLKHGQEIHKMYKVNDLGNDMIKEYRGIKGCRPDFVDFQNYIIYELKPYNPQGVRNGIKQLERYKRLFELKTGATWDTFIDFY